MRIIRGHLHLSYHRWWLPPTSGWQSLGDTQSLVTAKGIWRPAQGEQQSDRAVMWLIWQQTHPGVCCWCCVDASGLTAVPAEEKKRLANKGDSSFSFLPAYSEWGRHSSSVCQLRMHECMCIAVPDSSVHYYDAGQIFLTIMVPSKLKTYPF